MPANFILPKPPRPFAGRTDILSELIIALEEESLIVIEGIRGIGKTGLMLKLADTLITNADLDSGTRKVFWLDLYPGITRAGFMHSLMGIMETRGITFFNEGIFDSHVLDSHVPDSNVPDSGAGISDRDKSAGQIIFALNRVPVIFFVDNAENLPAKDRFELACIFSQYLRSSTFVFACNEKFIDFRDDPCSEADIFIRRVLPFNDETSVELLLKTLKRQGSNVPEDFIKEITPRLKEITGGLPLAIKIFADTIKGNLKINGKVDFILSKTGLDYPIDPDFLNKPGSDEMIILAAVHIAQISLPYDAAARVLGPEKIHYIHNLQKKFFLDKNGFNCITVNITFNQKFPVYSEKDQLDQYFYKESLGLAIKFLRETIAGPLNKVKNINIILCMGSDRMDEFVINPHISAAWMKYITLVRDNTKPDQFFSPQIEELVLCYGRWLFLTGDLAGIKELEQEIFVSMGLDVSGIPLELAVIFIYARSQTGYVADTEQLNSSLRLITNDPLIHSALDLIMGIIYSTTAEKEYGIKLLEKAEKSGPPGIKAVAMRSRACVLLDSGGFSEMDKLYFRSSEICRKHNFKKELLNNVSGLAAMKIHQGRFSEAKAILIEFTEKEKNRTAQEFLGEIYALTSLVLLKKNRLSESIEQSEKSLAVFKDQKMWVMYHMVLANHAQALTLMDQFDRAMSEYQKCLAFLYEIGDMRGVPIILNNISQAYYRIGNLIASARYLNESLEASRKINCLKNIAQGHINLAVLYFSMGRLIDALDTIDTALKEAGDLGMDYDCSRAKLIKAEILIVKSDIDQARNILESAREHCKIKGYALIEIKCLCSMGIINIINGDYSKAKELIDKSVIMSLRKGIYLQNLFNHIFFMFLLKAPEQLNLSGQSESFEKFKSIYLETAKKYDPSRLDIHIKIAQVLSDFTINSGQGNFETDCELFQNKLLALIREFKWEFLVIFTKKIVSLLFGRKNRNACPDMPDREDAENLEPEYSVWTRGNPGNKFIILEESRVKEIISKPEKWDFLADFTRGFFYARLKGEIPLLRKRALLPMMKYFAENPGKSFTIPQLYKAVWHEDFYKEQTPVIHVNIQRLRKLIERDPKNPLIILTDFNAHGEGCYYLSQKAEIAVILPV